jgi:pilus assembly protein CpaE
MKIQAVVVSEDPVYLNWLQNALPGASLVQQAAQDGDELIRHVQALERTDVVFFQFDPGQAEDRTRMIERFVDRMPDILAVAIGPDPAPELVLGAMRAGARDFFILRRDEANVAPALNKLLRRSAQAGHAGMAGAQGKLFTVVAAHPQQSIAFMAVHLALACLSNLKRPGERVLLLDAATPAGAGPIFLNINQTYSVFDAVNDADRCDQTLVETAFSKHSSGLYVLSLPEDLIGPGQFDPDEFLKLIEVLMGLFAVIVVSMDGHLPIPVLTGVIGKADRTLLTTDQSIMRSRQSKYLMRALRLDNCELDRTALIVDDYHKRRGLEPEGMAERLDLPLIGTLSSKVINRVQAMNSGEPMFVVAPTDPYCTQITQLAQTLMASEAHMPKPKQGFFARLFS